MDRLHSGVKLAASWLTCGLGARVLQQDWASGAAHSELQTAASAAMQSPQDPIGLCMAAATTVDSGISQDKAWGLRLGRCKGDSGA